MENEEGSVFGDLRCLICSVGLERVTLDHPQPVGGLVFRADGNYGSRVFDPVAETGRILALICDECVSERISQVVIETPIRPRVTFAYHKVSTVAELPG